MMVGCAKCTKVMAVILLIVGILYLGQDYAWWDFWKVSWFTAVVLILGIGKLANSKCPDCQAMQSGDKKK